MASVGIAFGSASLRADALGTGSGEGHQVFPPSVTRLGI